MPIDPLLLRDALGGNANLVRESERRRYSDPRVVDAWIEQDQLRNRLMHLADKIKQAVNECGRVISAKKKAKEADGTDAVVPADVLAAAAEGTLNLAESLPKLCVLQLKELSKALSPKAEAATTAAEEADAKRDALLASIGNIVHESVPVEINEAKGNKVMRTWGDVKSLKPLNHVDVMMKLGCMDTSARVTAMAGGRSFVLKGGLVQLQLALINYAMGFLVKKGYMPFYPPFFLDKPAMAGVAQLSQFDDELYKVTGEGQDKYLIATSEQPLTAYHAGKWYPELPGEGIKYAGVSTCFRKEAGSHGKDTLGIFRVHQFDKIEQFVVTSPRDGVSWKALDAMIGTSEEFMQSLGLPYRVVNICSGALNNAAAQKYDLEGWFPGSKPAGGDGCDGAGEGGRAFRELVSCSNTTDYLSRQIGCRFGQNLRGQAAVNVKEHPHMLNGTLCAVTRTMCCIAEHYQTEEGVVIPEVLRPFMLGTEILKYADASKYIDPADAISAADAAAAKPAAKGAAKKQ